MPVDAQSGRCACAPARTQLIKAFAFKNALKRAIGRLGVGDCGLTQQFAVGCDAGGILLHLRRANIILENLIDHHINAAEEETGHRCHAGDVFAGGLTCLQTADEGFRHSLVIVDSENQGGR